MAVTQHRRETISRGNGVLQKDTKLVTDNDDMMAEEPAESVAGRIIYFIFGFIIALLLMRFLLSLLGANRANSFADFIYSVSQPFAAPFFGLFNYQAQYGVSRFEFETLIAVLVYGLIAWALVSLVNIGRRRTVT